MSTGDGDLVNGDLVNGDLVNGDSGTGDGDLGAGDFGVDAGIGASPGERARSLWDALNSRARTALVLGGIVIVYLLALAVTGSHGVVHHRMPLGIVVLGVVYGSVTALGAMGLILVYRANRFINFAQGAMGSLVGVRPLRRTLTSRLCWRTRW